VARGLEFDPGPGSGFDAATRVLETPGTETAGMSPFRWMMETHHNLPYYIWKRICVNKLKFLNNSA